MYKRTEEYQEEIKKARVIEDAIEEVRCLGESVSYKSLDSLPDVRRVIEITDYDSQEPTSVRIELRKSDRIDMYRVFLNGEEMDSMGWSRIIESIRKLFPRKRSVRS